MIQYIIVFIILAGCVAWVAYKLLFKKNKGGSCCGCALAEKCQKPEKKKEKHSCCEQ